MKYYIFEESKTEYYVIVHEDLDELLSTLTLDPEKYKTLKHMSARFYNLNVVLGVVKNMIITSNCLSSSCQIIFSTHPFIQELKLTNKTS